MKLLYWKDGFLEIKEIDCLIVEFKGSSYLLLELCIDVFRCVIC